MFWKHLDRCKVCYLEINRDISAMAEAIGVMMQERGKNFDPKVTVMKFDLILQYSLLQVACSDYDLAQNEIVFIRDLTKNADYCKYISFVSKKPCTWADLLNSDIVAVRSLLRATEEDMKELSDEVVNVFAIADKATEYDFLSDLRVNLLLIISGLSMMDGDIESEDYSQSVLILDVVKRIGDLLGQ